jgi:hypothetical protein
MFARTFTSLERVLVVALDWPEEAPDWAEEAPDWPEEAPELLVVLWLCVEDDGDVLCDWARALKASAVEAASAIAKVLI